MPALRGGGERLRALGAPGALRAVLFDVDGTLVDSDPLHYAVFVDMFEQHCATEECTEELFRRRISGRHNPDIVDEFFPHITNPEDTAKFIDEKETAFRERAGDALGPISGLTAMVAAMDERSVRRVAVTNAPRKNAELLIRSAGLDGCFEALIVGDELPEAKPSPLPYNRGCELLGIEDKAAVLVCEDSKSGVTAAIAAGIACVGLTTSMGADELLELGCVAAVDDYHQLLELLGWESDRS